MKSIDTGSILVMAATSVLFVAALFVRGWTHDLLLEAGVFLVSVKLMIMAYKNSQSTARTHELLREIHEEIFGG